MPATLVRYEAKRFNLDGLTGLSREQMAQHYKLYEGYVKNTNLLNDAISNYRRRGEANAPVIEYAELKRRLGFEYNGMVLHEYFFGNLMPHATPMPSSGKLAQALTESFGSTAEWDRDFREVCHMRGVGWAILYQDPVSKRLNNHWITLHEEGHIAGYRPILVIDLWEHAFTVDYMPTDRAHYVQAVMQNIDWHAVEERLI